jgi:hypothetical protein
VTTDEQIDRTTDAERCAWIDALGADETLILYTPRGYKHALVLVSYFKRALARESMTVGERLEILEGISAMVDGYFTAAALALIAPAGDTDAQMIEAALSLDHENDERSFSVLTGWEVFGNLVRLNPTIMAAIKTMSFATREAA